MAHNTFVAATAIRNRMQTTDAGSQGALCCLVGPPGAGKSTVASLFQSIGVPVARTGDYIREETHRRLEHPSPDAYWETACTLRDQHGPHAPTSLFEHWFAQHADAPVVATAGQRMQAEVDWLVETLDRTVLVIRIDTTDARTRRNRYVESRIGSIDGPISESYIKTIHKQFAARDIRESPHPDHHVTIINDDTVRTMELVDSVTQLVSVAGGNQG